MSNYKYKEIKKTESKINDRLLNFIKGRNETDTIAEELDFTLIDNQIDINKPPFDHWISSDYMKVNGYTYIDEFLELYQHALEPLEIEILNQKSKSHISIFEIIQIDSDGTSIVDKFDSTSYTVRDSSIESVLMEGDYVFARVAGIRGEYILMGDVEYIPANIINKLVENIFIFFNRKRIEQPDLDLEDYLKRYSLDIYYIYAECLTEYMEDTDEDIPPIISDITDFQEYALDNLSKDYHIYMTNLMDIFEYGLMDKDLSLQDINQIDLENFFKSAVKDGFINSKEDYNSYLDTLKAYLTFLGPSNPKYKSTYNRVVEISKNRFKYMSSLKDSNFNYSYDKMLASTIFYKLNNRAFTFISDLDKFLVYIIEFEIELTQKRKDIKKQELISLNNLLKLSNPFTNARPSQRDSRIIDFLYHLSLDLNLTEIIDNRMTVTEKGRNFFKLKDEEKYAITLSYIWSSNFIHSISTPKIKEEVVHKFLNLKYRSLDDLLRDIPNSKTKKSILETGFIRYLILVGIAESDNKDGIIFTNLGRTIYKYMLSINNNETKIINLNSYKKSKEV